MRSSRVLRAALAALVSATAPGCSTITLQEASAPEVPCEAPDISVNHVEGGKAPDSPLSWEATCQNKRYLCSRIHQRAICDEIPAGVDLQREK